MIEPVVDPSLREPPIAGSSRGKRKAKGGSSSGNAASTSRRGRGRPRRARGSDDGVRGVSSTDGQTPNVQDAYNAESSKRLRIASPFKLHAAIQGRKDTLYGSGSSVAGPSRKSSRSGATGMESLASVAVAHDPRRNSSYNRPPYPFGLTPFRYPCHNLDLPPPPPGNPNDPNFRPFDPRAFHEEGAASTLSSNGTTSKSTPIHTPVDPSSSGPSRQYASATHHHYPARPHHYTGGYRASQAELEANAHAAYESISALLSASQYPVMDELGDNERYGPEQGA
ncbi:hypothetical protein CNH00285 [Cryptococcus deneoformans JEC21]|uniref:Uncharacterized protein n=2 Tax=Cryptococcus deneoformans TaxID=40410 RepID=A0A0S2M5Z9_CRYD1|nr:hypothetical protein CNH00285 [Cryptococcus neoformans var. neoformans JEC21]ALO69552.1 hypothetical protein CNH00285 [Cryptococcus neoformans var. neoformans JEC21]